MRKNREIDNYEQYIDLDISLKLDCLNKREVTSSVSRVFMGRSGKGLTTSLTPKTKITDKKQKSRTAITDITHQEFIKLFKKFKNLPHLCYKKKQVHNEPTEADFFLIKHLSKLLKTKNHVLLRTLRVKLEVVEKKTRHSILNYFDEQGRIRNHQCNAYVKKWSKWS